MLFDLIFISKIFSQESFNDFIEFRERVLPYENNWIRETMKKQLTQIVDRSIYYNERRFFIVPEFYIDYVESDSLLEFAEGEFFVSASLHVIEYNTEEKRVFDDNIMMQVMFNDKNIFDITATNLEDDTELTLYYKGKIVKQIIADKNGYKFKYGI